MVGRLSWKDGSGKEALPEGRDWLESPSGGPGVVGTPTWMVRRPSGRASMVERPFRRAERGWEALLEGREWSGGSPG